MAFGLSGLAGQQRPAGKFTQQHKASTPCSTTNLPKLKPVLLTQSRNSKFKKLRPRFRGKGAAAERRRPGKPTIT
jgi:hypothetical protein